MRQKIISTLYDENKIKWNQMPFSSKALWTLLLPIVIEQLLNSFMGMADTIMVSNVGSAAISAVSLVDAINMLVIQIFAALAAGAAIICSQYIGCGDVKRGNKAAGQVTLTVFVISTSVTIIFLLFREPLLHLVFGKVDAEVMKNSMLYFQITALSYPFLALSGVGSAFYRALGNSKFPMRISLLSNLLNIIGNAILIFGFQMGVAGAAISTLLSRVFCMVVIFRALRKDNQLIVVRDYIKIRPDFTMIAIILSIGIPSGIENGMFYFGRLAIQSTVSTMGTIAIAAQAMTNILENINGMWGVGTGICLMTVVGHCIGAEKIEEAKYYIVKLSVIGFAGILVSCLLVFLLTKPVTWIAGMEKESAIMCFTMISAITCVKPIVWCLSFVPAYGMRAAGDVKFSMTVSSLTMWFCRVALCIFLVRVFHLGPMAVWYGMFADWTLRSIIFTTRFISGKWISNRIV